MYKTRFFIIRFLENNKFYNGEEYTGDIEEISTVFVDYAKKYNDREDILEEFNTQNIWFEIVEIWKEN